MNRFVVFFITTILSSFSFADCNLDMTRQPYCLTDAAAKAMCNSFGKNEEALQTLKKCIRDNAKSVGGDVLTLCAAGSGPSAAINPNCGQGQGKQEKPKGTM